MASVSNFRLCLLSCTRLFTLRREREDLGFYCHPPASSTTTSAPEAEQPDPSSSREALTEYFRLGIDLGSLYQEWTQVDAHFKTHAAKFTGVRLLQQDPTETLIAFICSSNNNISRITLMLERLCQRYGRALGHCHGKAHYSFPTLRSLAADGCADELRGMGFGYRANYVQQAARVVLDHGGGEWLAGLRARPYNEVWAELQRLPGVGPKVADCVCLMGLNKLEAVPVDTHVWRVAQRDYQVQARSSSLTSKTYQEVGMCVKLIFCCLSLLSLVLYIPNIQVSFFAPYLGNVLAGLRL